MAEGNRQVTTISTIGAQSRQSRIVVALLKDGDKLELKVQEMRPAVFDVGLNHSECLKYLEEHRALINNLRRQQENHQTPIEGWMRKFRAEEAKEHNNMAVKTKLVYMCMAENLQGCWKALLRQLDLRARLLDQVAKFYLSAAHLSQSLERADQLVESFKRRLAEGTLADARSHQQAASELEHLGQLAANEYNLARERQQQAVELVGQVGSANLGDARANLLVADAQSLINFIATYLDPLRTRMLQVDSAIASVVRSSGESTTKTKTLTTTQTTKTQTQTSTTDENNINRSAAFRKNVVSEIASFNDLRLADEWLRLKVEQLNSSQLSSLGLSAADARGVLGRHEQILLECRAIEEATLNFNGRNIHALKSFADVGGRLAAGDRSSKMSVEEDAKLFEQQKELAERTRDVITILEARIVLLRRTIDFYQHAKEAAEDVGRMMRRLQVDNSLQSVHFVAGELELKDVSSVTACGATILSELQQLQLAQKHGERPDIVNLQLANKAVRSGIDELQRDLGQLKTILSQRRRVLMNEDSSKMANNFASKSQQLQFWLNSHARSFLEENNQVDVTDSPAQVRRFCEAHEQLQVALQTKTLEVEALLRSLPTLTENLSTKNAGSSSEMLDDKIQRLTDELRHDWISISNCLDRRIEISRKYLSILNTASEVLANLDTLSASRSPTGRSAKSGSLTPERSDLDIRSSVEQTRAQLSNQVKNFQQDVGRVNTQLEVANGEINDMNKQQLVEKARECLQILDERKQQLADSTGGERVRRGVGGERILTSAVAPVETDDPARGRDDNGEDDVSFSRAATTETTKTTTTTTTVQSSSSPPRFVRKLRDQLVEPFSTVELECETDDPNCRVEWFVNNFKKIPAKHSTTDELGRHRLTISQFSPVCCGTYVARASNGFGQAVDQCRLRLSGIAETADEQSAVGEQQQQQQQATRLEDSTTTITETETRETSIKTTAAASRERTQVSDDQISRIIQGVGETNSVGSNIINNESVTSDSQSRQGESTTPPDELPPAPASDTQSQSRSQVDQEGDRWTGEGTPQPPVFVQPLTDSLSRSSSRAGLVCLLVGNPPPTIEWLHNDRTVATSKCPPGARPNGNVCRLTIQTVDLCARGHYVCRASNALGQSTTGLTVDK